MNTLLTLSLAAEQAGEASTSSFGMGETILFYSVAVFMVACAIGMALVKQAAHSAILMVGVMLGLAMLYFSQEAYFLATVQVVVYTGAIMILFLFVLMLVGVAASDNYQKTSRTLRISAWVLGGLGALVLVAALITANLPQTGAVEYAEGVTNPVGVAFNIFGEHMFTMELTGALLILAAIGAVTLTHSDALTKKMLQPETAEAKMKAYREKGRHPGQLPAPGVYAATNAPNVAALSGIDGSPLQESVPRVVRAQGIEKPVGQVAQKAVLRVQADHGDNPEQGLHSLEASRGVAQSGSWGMPGARVDSQLAQPDTHTVVPQELEAGQTSTPQLSGISEDVDPLDADERDNADVSVKDSNADMVDKDNTEASVKDDATVEAETDEKKEDKQ